MQVSVGLLLLLQAVGDWERSRRRLPRDARCMLSMS